MTRDAVNTAIDQYVAEQIAPWVEKVEARDVQIDELSLQIEANVRQIGSLQTTVTEQAAEIERLEALLEQYEPPAPTPKYPMIFGGATSNNDAEFATLNTQWGPIRMSREYDSAKPILPVDQYSWYSFVTRTGFKYLSFSADPQSTEADYKKIPQGAFNADWDKLVASLSVKLPGVKGVVLLGNEPNVESKDITAATYRAAIEFLIDRYGYSPAPGWMWGVAFSNYNVWGGGNTAGAAWLPRRDDGPFMVETHFYGKTTYPDPADALGRTLMPEMAKHPKWVWGLGEMSAQEDSTKTKKGAWFKAVGDFALANGCATFLPFDTGVGGSAPINTSEASRLAVKNIAMACANNNWS